MICAKNENAVESVISLAGFGLDGYEERTKGAGQTGMNSLNYCEGGLYSRFHRGFKVLFEIMSFI